MAGVHESDFEEICCETLQQMGYSYLHGEVMDPDSGKERENYHAAFLRPRIIAAAKRINPHIPSDSILSAVNQVVDNQLPDLTAENHRLHDVLLNGFPVDYQRDGETVHDRVQFVDWSNQANEWLVVNQLTVVGKSNRRPDIVIFLNGMPFVVIELKGPESSAGIDAAYNQIQTYKTEIPELFRANLVNVISDGFSARYGTISADFDRHMRWRTVDGSTLLGNDSNLEGDTLLRGLLDQERLLQVLRSFTVFENDGKSVIKKVAGYHQFFAGLKGVEAITAATKDDGKGGVFWHTQGSGKSLLMAFLAGLLIHNKELENPTIVVITDRNDLDNQLFSTFSKCRELFGQKPEQADSVEELRKLLDRKVGGVIFSTIQKFRPEDGKAEFEEISNRKNILVFVDEAHRTQYGFAAVINEKTGVKKYGFAHYLRQALPKATFAGFSGTPVELVDRNTKHVFGDYIDIYDITRAVEDGSTVPIFYEAKIVKLSLDEETSKTIDVEFDDLTSEMDEEAVAQTGSKWSKVEALAGTEQRVSTLAKFIVDHFSKRLEAMDGKGMIVCMSRRICVELHAAIAKLKPDWVTTDDTTGKLKVVMTGSAADPAAFQPHIRSKQGVDLVARRFRDAKDESKLVIVRDMFLTGFDSPSMHTMYVDKPMQGHNLMQAITRVNRVFKDKPAGLVVDTIGIGNELKSALGHYSKQDRDLTGIDIGKALEALQKALDVIRAMFHGFDYSKGVKGTPKERLKILADAAEHVFALNVAKTKNGTGEKSSSATEKPDEKTKREGVKRFFDAVRNLDVAYKLTSGRAEAESAKDEIGFFCALRVAIRKIIGSTKKGKTQAQIDAAIQALVNQAVVSTDIIDILQAAGIQTPDISVLSDDFLHQIKQIKQKNLAVEALRKLLAGKIKSRTRTNVVKNQEFSDMLEQAMARYHNRVVDAVQVINELIAIAKKLQEEPEDGLTDQEVALYDALAHNQSALDVMGNEKLRIIAASLVSTIKSNSGVDWWKFDDRRANMRVAVKRILKKFGYPPDLQSEAIKTVVKQAEALASELAQS